MKNNKDIIKSYKKKITKIKLYNKQYFSEDNPKISDANYDKLKHEVLELEKRFPNLKKKFSVSKIVGSPPSNKFKKIKHLRPMLSLSNAFDKNDMEDFLKKLKIFLTLTKII